MHAEDDGMLPWVTAMHSRIQTEPLPGVALFSFDWLWLGEQVAAALRAVKAGGAIIGNEIAASEGVGEGGAGRQSPGECPGGVGRFDGLDTGGNFDAEPPEPPNPLSPWGRRSNGGAVVGHAEKIGGIEGFRADERAEERAALGGGEAAEDVRRVEPPFDQ